MLQQLRKDRIDVGDFRADHMGWGFRALVPCWVFGSLGFSSQSDWLRFSSQSGRQGFSGHVLRWVFDHISLCILVYSSQVIGFGIPAMGLALCSSMVTHLGVISICRSFYPCFNVWL